LIVQQNYFSDLYPAKILNLSAKSFFPCDSSYLSNVLIGNLWFYTDQRLLF